ncbi:MAG: zf-HC2 domain-containing protein [candidate division WOR-3 bacterium]|nr:MAG: zf-HC2 domain-containing protein [candidate division WOR-3 bacterium]
MNCDLPIELLSAYLDGELSEQENAAVESHLKECPKCSEELMVLQGIDGRVRNEVFEEPSRDFFFALNRRVMDKVKVTPRRSLLRFAPVFAPVAAAILVFIVLVEISPSRRIVGLSDRVSYQEVAPRQEVQISIPEPVISAKPAPTAEKRMAKAAYDESIEVKAPAADVAEEQAISGIDERERAARVRANIVRAIIDTTGTIVKVATGNTLVPEEDTILEKELAGQQLSPPTIEGKKKQVYFEMATTAEEEEEEK